MLAYTLSELTNLMVFFGKVYPKVMFFIMK
jgi:hypothetical protein